MSLREEIERLVSKRPRSLERRDRRIFTRFKAALNRGEIRAAEPSPEGEWQVNTWVKKAILFGFEVGATVSFASDALWRFFDKDTYPVRKIRMADKVRIVPGGSSVRDGVYLAPGVICMPPMFINVGAYVDEGTMVDSHALVGSCAQIGKNVHLSAAAQIGGVLEPVGERPVIIEDNVLVGGGCGVFEGTLVRHGAVLAPGTILTRSTPLYDIVRDEIYQGSEDEPLEVPANAVVVPGARALERVRSKRWRLSLYTPVIVKYRDRRTCAASQLEEALR